MSCLKSRSALFQTDDSSEIEIMLTRTKYYQLVTSALLFAASVCAADIVISLPGNTKVERHTAQYQCDAAAVKLGLPASPFTVEYINALPIALAVLPLNGKPLVFANVMSGSGARYAADRYVWWDTGSRGTRFSAPGEDQGSCHTVPLGK